MNYPKDIKVTITTKDGDVKTYDAYLLRPLDLDVLNKELEDCCKDNLPEDWESVKLEKTETLKVFDFDFGFLTQSSIDHSLYYAQSYTISNLKQQNNDWRNKRKKFGGYYGK